MRPSRIRPVILLMLHSYLAGAQDPHFSQFFMAPHFINPANVGTQYGDWTLMGNFRSQWGNAGTLFMTQTTAADLKVLGREDGMNTLAVGMSLMNDQSMKGAFRSRYASATVAYHMQLAEHHRVSAGFQGAYSHRRLDLTNLRFGNQFTGNGFDLAIPSGEATFYDMPAFVSLGAGAIYTFSTYNANVDVGYAMYDINRPRQSFLNQSNRLEPRHVFKLNVEYYTERSILVSLHNFYHRQVTQNYFAVGGSMGLAISPGTWDRILFAGGWFREGDSFMPYAGIQLNDLRVGLSYDVTYSKQNKGPSNPQSFEISMMYTKSRSPHNIPGCRIPSRFLLR